MTRRLGLLALCITTLALAASPALAADPGLTVLGFLKLGVGARAAAMGEAYVAVADDAGATYWNPAGLLAIEHNDVMGTHNEWIQDLRHEFVAFGARRGRHAVGVSFIGLYTEDIEARTVQGDFDGHFGYSDNAFAASYAFQVTGDLGVGGTMRYVRESVVGTSEGDFTLDGMAFDLGGTWRTPVRGVSAGAVLRNLGGQLSYDFAGATSFDLPTTLQAGLAYSRPDLRGGVLTVSADMLTARGDDTSVRMGAEYAYRGQYLIGAGYKSGLDNENVSFGVGYHKGVRVNYAFTPVYSDLGNSHRLSLGYAW
jgi:hypothetical protein